MKAEKQKKKIEYKSIKIREEHYVLVKTNKENTGTPMDYFIGQAIVEKLGKQKK